MKKNRVMEWYGKLGVTESITVRKPAAKLLE
jgi:hypothetical protein